MISSANSLSTDLQDSRRNGGCTACISSYPFSEDKCTNALLCALMQTCTDSLTACGYLRIQTFKLLAVFLVSLQELICPVPVFYTASVHSFLKSY